MVLAAEREALLDPTNYWSDDDGILDSEHVYDCDQLSLPYD